MDHALPPARWQLYLDLIRWDRPAGWLLLLWPTLSALWLAAGGFPGWHLLIVFTLGTILMRSAGCAVNDVADQDFDRHVQRTANRPITRGDIRTREALAVGATLALLAFALVLSTNVLTIGLSFGALAIAIAYPFAKRWVSMPQAVLGVAFSWGIPMAFAAVRGSVPAVLTAVLFLANLCWVLAYDTEYAMVDRDDDLNIGIRTSAITLGRFDVLGVMGFYILALILWGWVGWQQHLAWPYALGWAAAAGQVAWHFTLIRHRDRQACFRAFRCNHWVGFAIWVGLLAGT